MAESRLKKSLLNARVNLIFYVLALILSFFSRKIFLDSLGTDFIGLVGTLQNLLGFLNLAELGVGAAIGFVLYKPIFENDRDSINEIISVMGYVYRWIGLIILLSGIILSLFLPLIFPAGNTGMGYSLIYFAYYSLLASSLIGYFINYRQNLLGADQKNYIVTACFQSVNMTKIVIQLIVAHTTRNPVYWVAIELVFGVIYSLVLNRRIYKTYPWLKSNIRLGKQYLKKYPEVFKKGRQIFIHQINSFAQFQLTPLLTYAYLSLNTVACLGNYTLLFDRISTLLNSALESITASIGNLIAEGNSSRIIFTFWKLTILRLFIAGAILFGSMAGTEAFIRSWLGQQYVLPKIVLLLIVLNIYLKISTGAIKQFVYGYGLFGDVWASLIETGTFIVLAVIGGKVLGLQGLLGAGVLSLFFIQGMWKPYYLYSRGFHISTWKYWQRFILINLLNLGLMVSGWKVIDMAGISFSSNPIITIMQIVAITAAYCLVTAPVFYLLFPETREFVKSLIK
ncbi:MAG: sugar transporter [Bacteroides sp.]|nr:sugar transporter [Bacteroides sp.]